MKQYRTAIILKRKGKIADNILQLSCVLQNNPLAHYVILCPSNYHQIYLTSSEAINTPSTTGRSSDFESPTYHGTGNLK